MCTGAPALVHAYVHERERLCLRLHMHVRVDACERLRVRTCACLHVHACVCMRMGMCACVRA